MSIVGINSLINEYVPTFFFKNLVDGQITVYDSTKRAFVNADPGVVISSINRLGELLNVDDSVDIPLHLQNGQALVYDSFTSLWDNKFIDFNTLLNKPLSSAYSFIGLSDTAKPSLPSGYVKWNPDGDGLVYSTSIPAASITGLATVATTGNYNDLINTPVSSAYSFIGLSDTAKPSLNLGLLKWDVTGTQVEYVSTIPVSQVTGLALVATDGTLGSLTNVSPSVDTLNNTSDAGKTMSWNGSQWVSVNPAMRIVANLASRNALNATISNQAYVVNSDDGMGDYVNKWSLWIYTIAGPSNGWTLLAREEGSTSECSTIEYMLGISSPSFITVGTLPTGGRITLITVEIITPFNGSPSLEIGYTVLNPSLPPPVPAGLMTIGEIDLTTSGTYSTVSDILFGIDTLPGDIDITATFVNGGSTVGEAQIIISYV